MFKDIKLLGLGEKGGPIVKVEDRLQQVMKLNHVWVNSKSYVSVISLENRADSPVSKQGL